MKTPVLELRHVIKSFDTGEDKHSFSSNKIEILHDINLTISKGEFVSIVGPSGSGKSTLMYIVGALDKPSSGTVIVNQEDISKFSEKQLSKIRNNNIGFVFQMFNLLPRTTALENVLLPVIYAKTEMKEAKKRALDLMEKMGIGKRWDHTPAKLSGGEQQRVAIARALINNPAIILADEPTGNLDSKSGKDIMEIFKKLHKEGNTIILVPHDPDVANQAERTIRISDGRIA